MSEPTSLGRRLRFVRPAVIAILALDLIALAAFAVRVETVTRTTTTPAAQLAAPVLVPPSVAPLPDPGSGSVLVPTTVVDAPSTPAPVPAAPTTGPARPTPTPTGTPTVPEEPAVRIARCPIEIKEPESNGGLQSLVDFAPAFGPFSAEAFAAASAYQPLLQVIGPVLAQYPKYADQLQPALAPLLGAWQQALDSGFALLGPLYAPYRTQVLEAESKLAAALAPYSKELAASPLAGCLVELQDALLEGPA